jgi:gluconolactonase
MRLSNHWTRLVCGVICTTACAVGAEAQGLLPGEREARVTAIPGVVAEGARWSIVWADTASADGIVGTPDGGVLFAQEQSDSIFKLLADGTEYTFMEDVYGIGSVSLDNQGRLFGVERTCTEPLNPEFPGCNVLTRVVQLAPERRVLANSFPDGRTFGRLNDLITDGRGGAYFTVGGAFHVSSDGVVTTVENQNLRSNGIMLSRDGRTLYVTNNTVVIAFDVARDGSTSNRRDFGALNGDDGGDGMAIDAEGRLYVTGSRGVHVFAESGAYLGLIPTPRRPITLAFSGPDKRTLYVPQVGGLGIDGQPYTTPEGIRNIAMTIYTLPMVAEGFRGRPK